MRAVSHTDYACNGKAIGGARIQKVKRFSPLTWKGGKSEGAVEYGVHQI